MRIESPSIPADAPYIEPHVIEAIERTYPVSEQLSGLKCAWSRVAKRWMVYQLIPHQAVPRIILAPTQKFVRVWHDGEDFARLVPDPKERLHPDFRMLNETQVRIWEETGYLSSPLWVIQGTKGGHQFARTQEEQRLLFMATNADPTPPAPGALPYAEPTDRTFRQLAQLDRVATARTVWEAFRESPEAFDADERAVAEQLEQELAGWLASQVEEAVDSTWTRETYRQLADGPRA